MLSTADKFWLCRLAKTILIIAVIVLGGRHQAAQATNQDSPLNRDIDAQLEELCKR